MDALKTLDPVVLAFAVVMLGHALILGLFILAGALMLRRRSE